MPSLLLFIFVSLGTLIFLWELYLNKINKSYYHDRSVQEQVSKLLDLEADDLHRRIQYVDDYYNPGLISSWVDFLVPTFILLCGGYGYLEQFCASFGSKVIAGLLFFGLYGLLMGLVSIPFAYYGTFVLEERWGFNTQTRKTFFLDILKNFSIAAFLGGGCLAIFFSVPDFASNEKGFLFAWVLMSGYTLLEVYIYPSLIDPLFNKFSPLPEGSLRDRISSLARKLRIPIESILVMDASKRTRHGNAYFTGIGRKKRVVLDDTLINKLTEDQILAVVAHEFGHLKLNHIFWSLTYHLLSMGLFFFAMDRLYYWKDLYAAFYLSDINNYTALFVFVAWYSLGQAYFTPFSNFLSRRDEFAADKFAAQYVDAKHLGDALLQMEEDDLLMPINHPWYSAYFYTHPPTIDRLRALNLLPTDTPPLGGGDSPTLDKGSI